MKKFLPLFAVALLAFACGDKKAKEAEVGDAIETPEQEGPTMMKGTTYAVDALSSQIIWTGRKIVGDSHTGTLDVSDGRLMVADGKLVGGEFKIDMNSLKNTDIEDAEYNAKLVGHLKDADFFEVEKYPSASFELVQIQPATGTPDVTHNLKGNLTMKGVTKSITIPANVVITDELISATTPAFSINRTDWGVKYGSGLAGAVGDNVISDDVNLVINLQANRS